MGFGAIVAIGENNTPLDEDLAGCIAEVRVEQKLDEPTQFAVRFIDDLEDGQLRHANDDRLAIDTIVTVIVEVGDALGLPGARPDRRAEERDDDGRAGLVVRDQRHGPARPPGPHLRAGDVDRAGRPTWRARSSARRSTLRTSRIRPGLREARETLNQRGTDLEFLTQIARQNNFHFWITYDCARSPTARWFR